MSGVQARIVGLERLAPQARQAVTTVGEHVKMLLLEGAQAVAANARARVLALKDEPGPCVLAESIRAQETEGGAVVIAAARHAPYVEFGTRRVAAQPFLAPAMEEERRGMMLTLGDGA